MGKLKSFICRVARKAKLMAGLAAVSAVTAVTTIVASAEEPSASTSVLSANKDAIVSEFQKVASDIAPLVVGVLGAGLGIFALFLGIRYAKKMLSTVAK